MKKIIILLISLLTLSVFTVSAELVCEWKQGDDGKLYWYENDVKQGIYGSKGNVWYDGSERGREIYDAVSDAWYWLDAVYNGAKAENKEVFMPYIYQDENNWKDNIDKVNEIASYSDFYTEALDGATANMSEQVKKAILEGTGKWVRYDSEGKMIKGWYAVISKEDVENYPDQIGNVYYYDYQTGLMAKGETVIDNEEHYFNTTSGVKESFWHGDIYYKLYGGKTNEEAIRNLANSYIGRGGNCNTICVQFTGEALGIRSAQDIGLLIGKRLGVNFLDRIDPSEARAGDTIAYYDKNTGSVPHVGVYLGNNSSLQGNYAGRTVIMNPYDVQLSVGAPKASNDPNIEVQFWRPNCDLLDQLSFYGIHITLF